MIIEKDVSAQQEEFPLRLIADVSPIAGLFAFCRVDTRDQLRD